MWPKEKCESTLKEKERRQTLICLYTSVQWTLFTTIKRLSIIFNIPDCFLMPKMKPVNSDLEISADQMRWYLATYFLKKKKHKWQWRQRQISKFHSYSCCGEEDGERVVLSTNRLFKSLWKSQDQAHGSGERLGGDTVLNTGPWRPLWESLRGTALGPRTCLTQHNIRSH